MGSKDRDGKDGKAKKKHRKAGAKQARPGPAAGSGKTRSLCKWGDDAYAEAARMAGAVRDATHVCRKCGRAANDRRLLCKPIPLADA